MLLAVTRPVSEALSRCELTHLARTPIDVDLARAQHGAYERALADAGCAIVRVDAAPELPDAVFIEDAAVVFDEVAIVTQAGGRLAPCRDGVRGRTPLDATVRCGSSRRRRPWTGVTS